MLSNSEWKQIQSLKLKKFRQKYREFLIEGDKIVLEAIASGYRLKHIIADDEWVQAHTGKIPEGIKVSKVMPHNMKKLSSLSTAPGIIAVAIMPDANKKIDAQSKWFLALDGLSDPGNLGTIIRTADWFGIHTILCSENCADCYNQKTVQASMGSIFRVEILYASLTNILPQLQLPVFAATLNGEPYNKIKKPEGGILLIGSESHGVSENLIPLSEHQITIPGTGKAESLNAAVACGILLAALT